ncbi:hypothetical protein [Drosophila suzukii associated hytrosavirus 1]|nr:hypothetical protein [Drosophila suzukii associated hytrosavirus 1]
MTTELYSRGLLKKILASIPANFTENLIVRAGEPNTLQLLKLAIRAFFNNILRCPFLDVHGNDLLKALWLLQNIECSKNIFAQYNYLDLYPYTDAAGYIPPFITSLVHPQHVVRHWNIMLEWLPNVLAAINSLTKARSVHKKELLAYLARLASEESTIRRTIQKLAVNLLFDVGEYNSTLDTFIDIFLPIDRQGEGSIVSKQTERHIDDTRANEPIYSEKSMCLLALSSDGSKILTILSESDKYSLGRPSA